MILLRLSLLLVCLAAPWALAATNEEQALRISSQIQAKHLPFGTIVNPMYVSANSNELLTYTRCGDSGIWTGHWLAAEAFRYQVTRSAEALAAVKRGVDGIRLLVDATGVGLLSRCVLRPDSSFSAGPANEEKGHGVYQASVGGVPYQWIGDTSRDQYLGAFFGLSVAYEAVPDELVRARIRDVVTRMLDRLLAKDWAVVMPNNDVSTVFWLRPDQQLAMLQVGRQVNPGRFSAAYDDRRRSAIGLDLIMSLEGSDPYDSYFKFNLDAISWYLVLHPEEPGSSKRGSFLSAYRTFRRVVAGHGNAFFNSVDLALQGPEAKRDAETQDLLAQWLTRPERDLYVDVRGKYRACGDNRSCDPIPVAERVTTDFVWQRSPYQMYGGGSGQIESAGIDFILPYWMARAYGAGAGPQAVSAASADKGLAPDAIATLYGSGFVPDGLRVGVVDAAGIERTGTVFFAGAQQVNFLVPSGTTAGPARIRVLRADGTEAQSSTVQVNSVAPAIFTANASGKGPPAALAIQGGAAVEVFRCSGPLLCVARPMSPREGRPVYLSLFVTGVRGYRTGVRVTLGGDDVPVEYVGAQSQFPGLDQVNVRLERTLRSRGEQDLVVVADGVVSNPVRILVE